MNKRQGQTDNGQTPTVSSQASLQDNYRRTYLQTLIIKKDNKNCDQPKQGN